MKAVIETGGKQYRVSPGMRLKVEKLTPGKDRQVVFDRVLLFVPDSGESVSDPKKLAGMKVKASVIEEGRNRKILVFKRKPKTDYKKAFGHRQPFTLVEIQEIVSK